jgi:hypothetical protein
MTAMFADDKFFLLLAILALFYRASEFVFARLITFCNFVTELFLKSSHSGKKKQSEEFRISFFDDFMCFFASTRRAQIAFVIKVYYTFSTFVFVVFGC